MPPSPEEQKDIDELIRLKEEDKKRTIDYLLFLVKQSPDDLRKAGYRNGLGDALERQVKALAKNIEIREKNFLKKWPD